MGALQQCLDAGFAPMAADGGAASLFTLGVQPQAIIGDMDSLPRALRDAVPPDRLHRIAEQDSTDFDKALRAIATPLVIGHGFLGRRVDHQLAVFNALVRHADRRCVLVGRHDVVALVPPRLRLPCPAGMRVSLFPMLPVTGQSTGLRWPLDGLELAPDGMVATSNEATGPVQLEVSAPGMLVILPPDAREMLITAVMAAPSEWPARA